jgi:hypothetical protein
MKKLKQTTSGEERKKYVFDWKQENEACWIGRKVMCDIWRDSLIMCVFKKNKLKVNNKL